MNQFTIVLADTDEHYVAQLEKRFIETCQDRANIIIITEEEYLDFFFSTPQNIDILVIQEDLCHYTFDEHSIASIFILTEHISDSPETQPPKIYKYTSVKEIYNEIFNGSALKNFHNMLEANTAKSIVVYSPIGGIGKTFTAIGLSVALAKAHMRVLFLSAEPLQTFAFFLTDPKYLDTSLINQFSAQNNPDAQDPGHSIGHELFDYLLPFPEAASSFAVKLENYQQYMQNIKESGKYDFIVLDLPADFSQDKSAMMAYCDKTVLLLGQHPLEVFKFERFLGNIDCSNTEKFIFLCNKYDGKAKNNILNSSIRTKIAISDYIPKLTLNQTELNIAWFTNCRYFEKLTYMLL